MTQRSGSEDGVPLRPASSQQGSFPTTGVVLRGRKRVLPAGLLHHGFGQRREHLVMHRVIDGIQHPQGDRPAFVGHLLKTQHVPVSVVDWLTQRRGSDSTS